MNNKVLFVICNRNKDIYGVTSGLYNSAKFVSDFLNTKGYDSKLEAVQDANSIDKVVTEFDPKVVVIEAIWVTPAKFKELFSLRRHQDRRWIVRVHSKAPFLANEGPATEWIRQYTEVENGQIEIAPNNKELTQQLTSAFPCGKFTYMPNVYFKDPYTRKHEEVCKDWIDVGCFGAVRPMKNTYQQALAAIEFADTIGKQLKFHVNGTRMEQNGESVMKNLQGLFKNSRHILVEHPWYTHSDFLDVAATMDLGMQVSFSESFNIVTADFVTAGVPIVASDDISWMPGICKTSPTSHEKMVDKLLFINGWRKIVATIQKMYLRWYSFKAGLIWMDEMND